MCFYLVIMLNQLSCFEMMNKLKLDPNRKACLALEWQKKNFRSLYINCESVVCESKEWK